MFAAFLGGSIAHAEAKATERPRLTLTQLIEAAQRSYPGVQAARHALSAARHQAARARWAFAPRGRLTGLFAPAPKIRCEDSTGAPNSTLCVRTPAIDATSVKIEGVMAQVVLDVGMPVYTFDKIGAAKRAAHAGIEVRKSQLIAAHQDLALKVTQAYWALKLARELLFTIKHGQKHLDSARKRTEKQLENQEGEVTEIDLLRLKTATAEVLSRRAKARELESLMLAALATLCGKAQGSFDIDPTPLAVVPLELKALPHYMDLAEQYRPELAMLNWALKAAQARTDLETAQFYPNLLIVGTIGYGVASSVDTPENAFYNNPYNFVRAGFGLALRWDIDPVGQVHKRRHAIALQDQAKAQAAEARAGIRLQLQSALTTLEQARETVQINHKGQKAARAWLVAAAQNLEAGLSESKELTDALVGYFSLHVNYLQSIFNVNVGQAQLMRATGRF
ncbi:MAG: TolC family protein [Deltaproteobacteria bacterium]|nr:TolC family protein [Deltaproteobacteria bacterium]